MILWTDVREERELRFDSLKPGDRFVCPEAYFTLRKVVRKGAYLESVVVGRFAQDRVSIELPETEPKSTPHGADTIVHRIVCGMDVLRTELRLLATIEALDRRLDTFGGGAAPDDFFEVFLQEYDRRGWPMPQ